MLFIVTGVLLAVAILGTGQYHSPGQSFLGGKALAETTPREDVSIWWDRSQNEPDTICIESGAWAICVSGESTTGVSWRASDTEIAVTITAIVPQAQNPVRLLAR